MRRIPRVFLLIPILALLTAFVGLGLWQLRRHDAKRTYNAQLTARASAPALPVEQLFAEGVDVRYRAATAVGTFDVEREIVITGRTRRAISGNHVLTPLLLADGRALLVDRGWVPLAWNTPPVREAAPPPGRVSVEGILLPSDPRGRLGPKLPEDGTLSKAPRIDVSRFAKQLPYEVLPLWLQLRAQEPPQAGEYPKLVPLPTRDPGPHLSYAIQWFAFAVAAVVGFTALEVRRRRAGVDRRRDEVGTA